MRDPSGMVKERKQGPLDLSIVKELQLGSMEQAKGKTAFPQPPSMLSVCAVPLGLLMGTTALLHALHPRSNSRNGTSGSSAIPVPLPACSGTGLY